MGLLSPSTAGRLSRVLMDLQRKGTMQLQILTLPSLGDLSIEEASIKIVDAWKLGNKDTDKGVLFLIVPSQRKMRIEVGQGLEGDIPDVIAKRIIADVVTPYFKAQRYDEGVTAGVVALVRAVDPTAFGDQPEERSAPQEREKKGLPVWVLLLILFVLFIRFITGGGGGFGRRGPWGGGGFGGGGFGGGGGGWSGGGGGFSGGGASGNW